MPAVEGPHYVRNPFDREIRMSCASASAARRTVLRSGDFGAGVVIWRGSHIGRPAPL